MNAVQDAVFGLTNMDAVPKKGVHGLCRAQEVLDRMGIKASRQYTKLPRNKGGIGQGRQHQNGVDHASNGADVAGAAVGHIPGEGHANSLTEAAERAGAHANTGLGGEAAMVDAYAPGLAPSALTAEVVAQEQQPGAKRQRVGEGAGTRAHLDGMDAVLEPPVVLFYATKQCKEEVR